MSISILLADDHNVVRHGIHALLAAEHDFNLVGEAADGLAALQMAEQLEPDILVVDLMMPGLGGLEVTRQMGQRSPHTRVIILSMHDNEAYVLEALRNGAAGYVLKGANHEDLIQAIREVAAGRRYLSSPLSERAIEAYIQKTMDTTLDSYEMLTTREREILYLSATGLNTTEMGEKLSISPRTVESHKTSMMRKLGLRTQLDLIRYALKRGIIPMED